MTKPNQTARLAGLLYLLVVLTGIFSLAYVPGQLFVKGDPAKTFANLTAHETLFRLSIASSAVCYVAFTLLPLALYQLLKPVDGFVAKVMVVLAILSVPISLLNLQNKYAVADLIGSAQSPSLTAAANFPEQAQLYLDQYNNGLLIATLFWGLWLLPFGYLVFKSGFLPKLLGVLLMLGCLGYVVNFLGSTVAADYSSWGVSAYFGLLPSIGEIGACLWLLLVGVSTRARGTVTAQ
jgi:Domain of unknown function (DUF4386)